MDVDIALGGLDAVMSQHLFDLENGSPCFQQILGVGMSETVSGFGYACPAETRGDVPTDGNMGNGPIGGGQIDKEGSVFDVRPDVGHIDDNGLKGLLWQRESQRDGIFSMGEPDFLFGKADVPQRYEADLPGSETEGVCQVDHGVCADIPGAFPTETGEETIDLLRTEEPWGVVLCIERRPCQKGREVPLKDVSLVVKVVQESSQTSPVNALGFGAVSGVVWIQECIDLLDGER